MALFICLKVRIVLYHNIESTSQSSKFYVLSVERISRVELYFM